MFNLFEKYGFKPQIYENYFKTKYFSDKNVVPAD